MSNIAKQEENNERINKRKLENTKMEEKRRKKIK